MRQDGRFLLASGRVLAYAEWGSADGPAVLYLNGTPGSRVWCPNEQVTQSVGCRLLTLDRPGYGHSDPAARAETLRDWAKDLEQFVDGLGIERFAVAGWSSGALYALACAAFLPERITVAGVAGGACAPVHQEPGGRDELDGDQLRIYDLAQSDPEAACLLSAELADGWIAEAVAQPDDVWAGGTASDLRHFEDAAWADRMRGTIRESLRQGSVGYGWDQVTWFRPWGFELEDITAPFHIWHGGEDPWEHMDKVDYMASRITDATVTVWPESGHLVIQEHWRDILATLLH